MLYRYFISYVTSNHGTGRCAIETENKIESIEDIFRLEKVISEIHNDKEVCINNYILMKVIEAPKVE